MRSLVVLAFFIASIVGTFRAERIDFENLRTSRMMRDYGVFSRCRNPRHVTLTFDDGIHPANTPKLLKILKKYDIRAAFFILGQTISKYSDLQGRERNDDYKVNRKILKRLVNDGHEVGNHSFNHPVLTDLSKKDLTLQLTKTNQLIHDITGKWTKYMRAPEGALDYKLLGRLKKMNYLIIHWNIDLEDWKYHESNPWHMVSCIDGNLAGGNNGIILQHDSIKETVEKQERIIRLILERGFEIVSLSECIGN